MRKGILLYLIFFILIECFILGKCYSAFMDSYLGARSMAMGGAYTAIANDADGGLVNPAGLSMINGRQLTATTAILHIGLDDESMISQNIVGYAHKADFGSIGGVWKRFNAGDLYYENVLVLSCSRLGSLYFSKGDKNRLKNISYGGSIKLLNWDSAPTIDLTGRTVEDLSGWTGINFDLGFVIFPSVNTPVAISFQNIRKSYVNSKSSNIDEKLPMVTRMGVAAIGENTTWVIDLILKQGEIDLKIGLERKFYDGDVLVRTGIALENLAWGMNYTIGAGYKLSEKTRIDYAFMYPVNNILETFGSHRVSIVYNFGDNQ